jgi:CRISPR/Cas system CMR subunit Cmr4 (Cas7 group RAMP superfamily)
MATNKYMEARSIAGRIVVKGTLVLASPTHLGGNDPSDILDSPIARDPKDRSPILHGTTLAGLLRHALLKRTGDESLVTRFFGSTDANSPQSALIIDDSISTDRGTTDIRDGVALDAESGTAEDGKKFDMEFLRIGTAFPLCLELLLFGPENGDEEMRGCLLTCLDALEKGEVFVGARSRKGFGRIYISPFTLLDGSEAKWTVYDFAMTSKEGVLQWAAFESGLSLAHDWPRAEPRHWGSALEWCKAYPSCTLYEGRKDEFSADLHLVVADSLIVRSDGESTGDADSVHITRKAVADLPESSGQPVLPGTSLAGAIRARASKIAGTFAGKAIAKGFIDRMFGTSNGSGRMRAGRLYIDEEPIDNSIFLRHARTQIDSWTGGSLEHHLFEEDALYGGTVRVRIRLVNADDNDIDEEIGLLLLVIKDLVTGDLPVGGEGSIGRGRLFPTSGGDFGTLSRLKPTGDTTEWRLKKEGERHFSVVEGENELNRFVSAFREAMTRGRMEGGANNE